MKICPGRSCKKITALILIVTLMFISGCSSVRNYTFNGVQLGKQYAQADQKTATDATPEEKTSGEKSWFARNPGATIVLGILAAGAVYYGLAASGALGSGAKAGVGAGRPAAPGGAP